jgi:hypothetical protein
MDGDKVLQFGPHQGRTFADIAKNESRYCRWVKVAFEKGDSSIGQFRAYLDTLEDLPPLEDPSAAKSSISSKNGSKVNASQIDGSQSIFDKVLEDRETAERNFITQCEQQGLSRTKAIRLLHMHFKH